MRMGGGGENGVGTDVRLNSGCEGLEVGCEGGELRWS